MTIVLAIALCLVILFAGVLLFGAPYLPTLQKQHDEIFKLLNLKSGQTLLELGSGDGRILRAAAKRGIRAIGYELNPLLVLYAKLRNWPYRRLAHTYLKNFWKISLEPADGIYVFLLSSYMAKLDKKIIQEILKPTPVVSLAFVFPGRKIVKKTAGLLLYNFQPKTKDQ